MGYPNTIYMSVKAKFTCIGVEAAADGEHTLVNFLPVTTGSEENKSFAKYTPAGSVFLSIHQDTPAASFFEGGKEYYLTFEEAPAE
jgi:hypothetical protein